MQMLIESVMLLFCIALALVWLGRMLHGELFLCDGYARVERSSKKIGLARVSQLNRLLDTVFRPLSNLDTSTAHVPGPLFLHRYRDLHTFVTSSTRRGSFAPRGSI